MKTKAEILRALARTDEDKVLLAGLMDKLETCQMRGYPTNTRFLDLRERAIAAEAVRLAGGVHSTAFWGGYVDAERVCALFYPEYMTEDDAVAPENLPFVLLRAQKSPSDTLTHRDYLGALMGLGIERSVVGDIIVHERGADLLVLEDIADFLLLHYHKAGRKNISVERVAIDKLYMPEAVETEGEGSVSSLRLDSVTALIFGKSRGQAQEWISKGIVFLNQQPCMKAEREIGQGDRITVRGQGRARILSLGGISRRGRQFVRFARS